jgi:hypothetical protein
VLARSQVPLARPGQAQELSHYLKSPLLRASLPHLMVKEFWKLSLGSNPLEYSSEKVPCRYMKMRRKIGNVD